MTPRHAELIRDARVRGKRAGWTCASGRRAVFFVDHIRPMVPNGRGYQPDVVLYREETKRLLLVEIEVSPGPAKVLQDMLFSTMVTRFEPYWNGYEAGVVIATSAKEYIEAWRELAAKGHPEFATAPLTVLDYGSASYGSSLDAILAASIGAV